jgi:hypothetical protein
VLESAVLARITDASDDRQSAVAARFVCGAVGGKQFISCCKRLIDDDVFGDTLQAVRLGFSGMGDREKATGIFGAHAENDALDHQTRCEHR